MIVFDSSYLLIFLRDNMPPARDRNDKPVEKFKERIQFLIASLDASNTIIGIPTPALAEIMVRAGAAGPEYLKQLRRANFVFLPFDTKAAIEAASEVGIDLQIVKNNNPKVFEIVKKRWIVERSFAYLDTNRRNSKYYERLNETGIAMLQISFIRMMLNRLNINKK